MTTPLWLRALIEALHFTKTPERADAWPIAAPIVLQPKPTVDEAAPETELEVPAVAALRIVPPYAEPRPHFDNIYGLGYRDLKAFDKRRSEFIDPKNRRWVVVHQMAVTFGTSAARRKVWRKRIEEMLTRNPRLLWQYIPGIPAEALHAMTWEELSLAIRPPTRDAMAERLALHERFWAVPYHFASLLNGDVLRNQPLNWYTYHGNGGNPGIGWAMEGLYPDLKKNRARRHSVLDDFVIETGRVGLRTAVTVARNEGCPIEAVQPHRNFSGDRTADTGEELWREIVLPVAKELGLKPDYTLSKGTGRPIPREWDDAALYDFKGKKIR